jgi:hypothetical protein
MGKQISIEILAYIGTEQFSSALGTFGNLGSVTATSGDASATPMTTPEPEALKSNFAVGTQWRGWYADGSGDYYVSTAAPTSSAGQLTLPIAPANFSLLEALSACGVYTKLTNLEIGATYTVTINISQSPASGVSGIDHLDVGSGINYNSGTAITQTNGTVIYPAFGNFGVGTFYSTGTHTVNLTAEHTSGYFSVVGYGNGTGDWIVDSVIISPVGSSLKKQVFGTLDITDSKNFPLAMSYTISDGKDLESRFGDFSKSFDIPATKNNNKLLNHIYDPLIKDDKNISGLKDCRIMVDGITFFNGQIQVKGSKQTSRPQSYSATIYGGNFAWASLLRDKRLCDLSFASLSSALTYDYSDIITSWTETQATSDIVYPLVSYGDFFPTGSAVNPSVNLYDAYTPNQDWRLWVYVYNIIQEIFSGIGYTISSSFIETANFKKLISYLPYGSRKDTQLEETYSFRAELNGTCAPCCAAGWRFLTGGGCGSPTLLQEFQNATNKQVKFPTIITDPSGSWNTSTNKWTCQRSGNYKFNGNFNSGMHQIGLSGNQNTHVDANLHLKHTKISTGVQLTIATQNIINPTIAQGAASFGIANSTLISTDDYIYMAAGDIVELQTTFDPVSYTASFNWWLVEYGNQNGWGGTTFFEAQYSVSQLEIGEDFALSDVLPCETTQIDFIKAISHLFNLYFTTDVQRKIIYIEPFNDFFTKDGGLDWTEKLDLGKAIGDNYDIGLTQEINFKYKEDGSDGYLKQINEDPALKNPRSLWYSYYENLGSGFKKGVTEFENPLFSPTQQEHDHDVGSNPNPVLIPVLWKDPSIVGDLGVNLQPSRPEKGFSFAPRIAYYHGYEINPNNANLLTKWNKSTGVSTIVYGGQQYPRATFVDWEDTTFPSLSYDDETVTPPNTTTSTNVKGLYSTYWKNMIEQLKTSPRIRQANINLKTKDILNLDMKKLIYIDGSWWRINKIVDFSPAKNETTKVELIQWIDI